MKPNPLGMAMSAVLLAGGVAAASVARADCKPVLDAMQKVNAQQRVASLEVDDEKSAPKPGGDVSVRIGTHSWQVLDGKTYDAEVGSPGESIMQKKIAEFERSGKMNCESLGAGTYRGTPVMRYRFTNPMTAQHPLPPQMLQRAGVTSEQVGKFTMLIDKSSGLPVYSESYTPTGIKIAQTFLYGDAVKESVVQAAKGKK